MQTKSNQPLQFSTFKRFSLLFFLLVIPFLLSAQIDAGEDATICEGTTLNISATSDCDHPSNVYLWTTPGGSSIGFNPTNSLTTVYTPSASDVTAGSVLLIITRTTAGGQCIENESDTLTLTIVSSPAAPTASSSSTTLCSGQQFQLFASTVNGASYSWSGPNGFNSSTQNPIISSANTNNSGSYTVTATIGNCTSLASNSVSITVNQTPNTPSPTSNSPVCAGGTLNLSVGNLANVTFNWTGPNNFTSNIQQPSITNVTAAAAGMYSLTVTSNNGNCVSSAGNVNVLVNPLPVISITPTSQTICSGQTTSISLSSNLPSTTYSWTVNSNTVGATNSSGSTISQLLTNSGASPASAVYTVTPSSNNCSGSTGSITVTVNPAPTANAGSAETICQGSSVDLEGTVDGSATGGLWASNTNPSGTFSNVNALNSTWTPPAEFSGSAILTLTTIGQTAPCSAATSNVTITVLSTPIVSTASAQSICQGEETEVLGGSVGGAASGGSWISNIPGGTFSGDDIANTTWTPPGSFVGTATLTLITTGMEPCNADSASLEITVFPLPTVETGLTQTICQGESTSGLNGNVDGSATGGIWTSDSGGTFSDSTDLNATWTPPLGFDGPAILTLTTTGMAPCESVSEEVTIIVNPNISAEVTFENNPFCESLSTVQIPDITGENNGTFSNPSGLSINPSTGNINPSLSNPGVYDVIYTVPGLEGCPDFEFPLEIVIATIPDALLTPDFSAFICENSSVVFEVNENPFNAYTDFEWAIVDAAQNPIGTIEENNNQSIVYSIGEQTQEITVTVVLTETIGSCNTTSEIPLTVRVNPETCGFFELAGDVFAACSEEGSFYQWGCGTAAISGENSNSFVHTAFSLINPCDAFWVQVSIYEDFSCPVYLGDASQITGISDETLSSQLLLYPNPTSGIVTLKYGSQILQSGLIEVFSYDGKLCYSDVATPGLIQQTIDISHLSAGSYVLSLTLTEGRAIQSFIVSK